MRSRSPSTLAVIVTAVFAAGWMVLACAWKGRMLLTYYLGPIELGETAYSIIWPDVAYWVTFTLALLLCVLWIRWGWPRSRLTRATVLSLCYVPVWLWLVFATDALVWDSFRVTFAQFGLAGLFFLGLAWIVWGLEKATQYYESRRRAESTAAGRRVANWVNREHESNDDFLANPFKRRIWSYFRGNRLSQSVAGLVVYSAAFMLLVLLVSQLGGCQEIYEMPAGGGKPMTIAQTVKIEKKKVKKFIINPFSSIIFTPPPIDDVKLQLTEVTQHKYAVGYGEGTGAGFSGGTARGKVRFIRLEYSGGDWDQDLDAHSDYNMLHEYGLRTSHPIAEDPETRTIGDLARFEKFKSPPVVYMTGQRSIGVTKSEVKILRDFLLDKHGMLFADNGGPHGFHSQFLTMMRQVLPEVEPVSVQLDDPIHKVPYIIPFLPYIAKHGGSDALGWKVDGRWVCYYHPGDIGDGWKDGHSGVKTEIWENCYQLGTNVIFYAHVEYSKWLDAAQHKK